MPYAAAADGSRIHYRLEGPSDAPVLMLSNSLGTDLDLWERQLGAFPGFRVLRYDTRGHGGSDAPAGEYSLDLLGLDAVALLDATGVDRVAFCGISMGGAIAQWLALNAPDRVSRLVLANTAALFGVPAAWEERIETVRRDGMAALAPGILERWFTARFRQASPEAVAPVEAMLLACPPDGYAGCCAALRDIDLRADLARIAAPTLVIGGAHDPATPPERAEELAAGIAGAELVMLDAAHLSNIEQAAAFNAALTRFLGAT
jgi:3-oxoadipate enol-lactonase